MRYAFALFPHPAAAVVRQRNDNEAQRKDRRRRSLVRMVPLICLRHHVCRFGDRRAYFGLRPRSPRASRMAMSRVATRLAQTSATNFNRIGGGAGVDPTEPTRCPIARVQCGSHPTRGCA